MSDERGAERRGPRIAVVGVCGAGKTTLLRRLVALGYEVREPAQEHSGVHDLWRRLTKADVLVYLGARLETVRARGRPDWPDWLYAKQLERVAYSREHADICILTDELTEEQVFEQVRAALAVLVGEPGGVVQSPGPQST